MKKPRWTLRIIRASHTTSEVDEPAYTIANEYPATFKLTAQLTFAMLSQMLKNPTLKASPFAQSTLNLYLTIVLMFLFTLSKYPIMLAVLEQLIPRDKLAKFFATIPHNVMVSQGLNKPGERKGWINKIEGRLILDVIVGKCATILKLFTSVKMSHCGSGRMPSLS